MRTPGTRCCSASTTPASSTSWRATLPLVPASARRATYGSNGTSGAAAQERRDWKAAAEHYVRAWRADPSDLRILYRLSQALKAAGRLQDAEEIDRRVRGGQTAKNEILALYKEADAVKDLGVTPHPDLCHRLADLRDRMGRTDEALAWHRLVLRDLPADPVSLKAIKRLEATVDAGITSRR